jgi:hypothetical protein
MKTQNDTETKAQGRTGSQFTLYLNPKTVAKFDRLAAKRKTTRSKHVTELMEQAVSAGLKKRAMA